MGYSSIIFDHRWGLHHVIIVLLSSWLITSVSTLVELLGQLGQPWLVVLVKSLLATSLKCLLCDKTVFGVNF